MAARHAGAERFDEIAAGRYDHRRMVPPGEFVVRPAESQGLTDTNQPTEERGPMREDKVPRPIVRRVRLLPRPIAPHAGLCMNGLKRLLGHGGPRSELSRREMNMLHQDPLRWLLTFAGLGAF